MKIMKLLMLMAVVMPFGCGSDSERQSQSCLPVVSLTTTIEVLDKMTSLPIACGTTVTLSAGEQIVWHQTGPNPLAPTCDDKWKFYVAIGSGTYTVTVSKPGYSIWQETITVHSRDQCGYTTDAPELTAYLDKDLASKY